MKIIKKDRLSHSTIRVKNEVEQVVSLRVKPSQAKYWKQMTRKFGIKDFSSFVRGAVDSAFHSSLRNEDPKWHEFIEAIQPTAKRILGHSFFNGGAKFYEYSGSVSTNNSAKEFLEKMKLEHNIS